MTLKLKCETKPVNWHICPISRDVGALVKQNSEQAGSSEMAHVKRHIYNVINIVQQLFK